MDGEASGGFIQRHRPPMFTTISVAMLFMCVWTPMLLLSFAVMITIGTAVIGIFRQERFRWIGAIVILLSIALIFLANGSKSANRSSAALSGVKLSSWSWDADPAFGTSGAIRWRSAVQNLTDRPIARVKIEFSSFDADGKLLTSSASYVRAIPPLGMRTDEALADLYGTEATARAEIVSVDFASDE